ncbi:class I SAM-dependent methyltransferase, partial [bacterium]|nr:class I SAM-dependent methyltransferase [bacterium]
MWDDRYAADEYVYGTEPNEFLASMTAKLKLGRALCLAEGEGRNAVHLAKAGFEVTAVDSSRVGLQKAEQLAANNEVTIETVHADLAEFEIEPEAWDSIISIFGHVPPDIRRR